MGRGGQGKNGRPPGWRGETGQPPGGRGMRDLVDVQTDEGWDIGTASALRWVGGGTLRLPRRLRLAPETAQVPAGWTARTAPKPPTGTQPTRPSKNPTPDKTSVYYPNCDAARRDGAAPVYRGDSGYGGRTWTRDGDGVGCESSNGSGYHVMKRSRGRTEDGRRGRMPRVAGALAVAVGLGLLAACWDYSIAQRVRSATGCGSGGPGRGGVRGGGHSDRTVWCLGWGGNPLDCLQSGAVGRNSLDDNPAERRQDVPRRRAGRSPAWGRTTRSLV